MKIAGLQKTTLVDYPGRVACTLFLFGCSFRCGFCYNASLVLGERAGKENFSEEYILDFLKKRKKYLEGVCITGGEPLMTLDKDFVRNIKKMGYFVKIDTNGSFPLKLKEFIEEGLVDFVSMDVKTRREDYLKVAGVDVNIKNVEKSLKLISDAASEGKLEGYEFRTTIVRRFHDLKVLEEMGKWVSGVIGRKVEKWALQGFRNEGDFVDKSFENEKRVGEEYIGDIKNGLEKFVEKMEVRA